jgi:hypothetical protein
LRKTGGAKDISLAGDKSPLLEDEKAEDAIGLKEVNGSMGPV